MKDFQNSTTDEKQSNVTIKTCSTSLCNDDNFIQERCIRCSSSQLNESCYNRNFTAEMMVSCKKLVTSKQGCFSAINLELGEVRRDCVSKFPTKIEGNWDIYDICYGEFCNSQDYNKTEEVASSIEPKLEEEQEPATEKETEIEPRPDSEPKPSLEIETEIEMEVDTETYTETEIEIEFDTDTDTNTNTKTVTETYTGSYIENKTDAQLITVTIHTANTDQWCLECKSEIAGECSLMKNYTKFEKICDKINHSDDQRGCFTWQNGNSIKLLDLFEAFQFYIHMCQPE